MYIPAYKLNKLNATLLKCMPLLLSN